jgi:hypothetical protein
LATFIRNEPEVVL